MEVLLCRHGNTFKKGHPPVWIGQKVDPPLTEQGKEQANRLATYLINNHCIPTAIFTASLKRTTQFASILAKKIGVTQRKIFLEDRLNEIKYGIWEGKTTEKLINLVGEERIKQWELGEISEDFYWDETKDEIFNRISSFLDELSLLAQQEKVEKRTPLPLLVTSNGVLKVIYQIITQKQAPSEQKISVDTGALCKAILEKGERKIIFWNQHPR